MAVIINEDRIKLEDVDVTERGVVFKLLKVIDREYEQEEEERMQKLEEAERRRIRILRTEGAADIDEMTDAMGGGRGALKHTSHSDRPTEGHADHHHHSHDGGGGEEDADECWWSTRQPGHLPRPTQPTCEEGMHSENGQCVESAPKKVRRQRDPDDKEKYLHYQALYIRKPTDKTIRFLTQENTEPMYKYGEYLLLSVDVEEKETSWFSFLR